MFSQFLGGRVKINLNIIMILPGPLIVLLKLKRYTAAQQFQATLVLYARDMRYEHCANYFEYLLPGPLVALHINKGNPTKRWFRAFYFSESWGMSISDVGVHTSGFGWEGGNR